MIALITIIEVKKTFYHILLRILFFFSPGTGVGLGMYRWAWIVWKNHRCSQVGRNVQNIFNCNSKPGPEGYHFCCGKFFSIQFVCACHVGASTLNELKFYTRSNDSVIISIIKTMIFIKIFIKLSKSIEINAICLCFLSR